MKPKFVSMLIVSPIWNSHQHQ